MLIQGRLTMQQPEAKTLRLRKQSLNLLFMINFLKTWEVKMAAIILPTAPLAQIKLMVCLETPTLIARKTWVEPTMPLTKPMEMQPIHKAGITMNR